MVKIKCAACGAEKEVQAWRGHIKYCDARCYNVGKKGSGNPKWRGGSLQTKDGYTYIYAPSHPDAVKMGYVLEHRLVMEKHLGRRLLRTEAVHHINGDRQDNRVENLVCCASNGAHTAEHHIDKRNVAGQFGDGPPVSKRRFDDATEQAIYVRRKAGETYRELAAEFGCTISGIYSVVRRVHSHHMKSGCPNLPS